jgi:hypothetical protein
LIRSTCPPGAYPAAAASITGTGTLRVFSSLPRAQWSTSACSQANTGDPGAGRETPSTLRVQPHGPQQGFGAAKVMQPICWYSRVPSSPTNHPRTAAHRRSSLWRLGERLAAREQHLPGDDGPGSLPADRTHRHTYIRCIDVSPHAPMLCRWWRGRTATRGVPTHTDPPPTRMSSRGRVPRLRRRHAAETANVRPGCASTAPTSVSRRTNRLGPNVCAAIFALLAVES